MEGMGDYYGKTVITPNDKVSKLAKEINVASFKNCPAIIVLSHEKNNFRGPIGVLPRKHIIEELGNYSVGDDDVINFWTMAIEAEADGAGGKPQYATSLGDAEVFFNLAWEIVTMNRDDFARTGRFPFGIINSLNIKKITEENFPLIKSLFYGFGKILELTRMISWTGETAGMKHSITSFCDRNIDNQLVLTWDAACIGFSHRDLYINAKGRIQPDMPIVFFYSPGYRCNGGTFLTELGLQYFGSEQILENRDFIKYLKRLSVPSKSYADTILRVIGWGNDGRILEKQADICGIAHITGGGVWEKFGEILPNGIGANLNNLPDPDGILLEVQEMSQDTALELSDWGGYGTLNGGIGMLSVCRTLNDAEKLIKEAEADGILAGIGGYTTNSKDKEIIICSQFLNKGKILSSLHPE